MSSAVVAQPELEEAKRAYFEGRFEESIEMLRPLSESASSVETRREVAFFLGLNQLALGDEPGSRSQFESAVRHDPAFEPPSDLFNPTIVEAYERVRSELVGRLVVTSSPPGASVRVGATEVGVTPYQGTVLAGAQLVRLTLDGFANEEAQVIVRPGEEASLSLTLQSVATADASEPATDAGAAEAEGGISGKTIGIIAAAGGGAGVALAAAGGGGGSTTTRTGTGGGGTTPQTPTSAQFAMALRPTVIQSRPANDPDFMFLIEFEVVIQETNGLGGNVNFINVSLRNNVNGGTTAPVNFGAGAIAADAGSNRIEPRGQLVMPVGIVYNFPQGSSAGTVIVEAQLVDTAGNRFNITAQAVIR